jgi:hypothetical protein
MQIVINYLFIYLWFYDALSNKDFMDSNDRMIIEQ